jgi:4-hydroxybenzoate polyprenyltransferase
MVFLPIFFVGGLFNVEYLYLSFLGFISLCLLSSSSYVINDIVDLKKDQLHPEKRSRPLASGEVNKVLALILTIILFSLSLTLGYFINFWFLIILIGMFGLTLVYTFWLKKVIFADILTISTLFVLRAVAGALAIQVKISPWLILCPFFLALFLAVGKRHADLLFLGDKAEITRKVLQEYTLELTNSLMIISTTLFVVSYSMYSFLSVHEYLLITLPFASYVVFRFFYLINKGSVIARSPEKAIKDYSLLAGILLWILSAGVIIYG